MEKFVCDHPWTHFEVNNPNGDVTMCCDNNTVLGNINDDSVLDIWNADAYQDIRRCMRDDGAHSICPHTCPVLNGFKNYQRLDWYDTMAADSPARLNAEQNQAEISQGSLTLETKPRWMRFSYSYACNLDCYHCYQRDDATQNTKVPDSFMKQVHDLAPYYQIIFYFGGEPFLYKPVLKMMENINTDPDCRMIGITNATLLNKRIKGILEKVNIGHFAVSLDAATAESYGELRARGTKVTWAKVLDNVRWIADLKTSKDFTFTTSMTLNSVNFDEVERFIDLGLELGAEPLVILASNPYQTYDFQKSYLVFTDEQFRIIEEQIQRALEKVRAANFKESEMALQGLHRALRQHKSADNHPVLFMVKKALRPMFRSLPEGLRTRLRKMLSI